MNNQADELLERLKEKLPTLSQQKRVSLANLYNLLDNDEDIAVKISAAPSENTLDKGLHVAFKRKLGQEFVYGYNLGEPEAPKTLQGPPQHEESITRF